MDVKDTSVEAGDNRRGGADRVRERAVRACRAGHGHAAGGCGLAGLGGQGQRPPGGAAGQGRFDAAMLAALAGEKALAADETPVNVLDKERPAARRAGRTGTGPRTGAGRDHHPPPLGRRSPPHLPAADPRRPGLAGPPSSSRGAAGAVRMHRQLRALAPGCRAVAPGQPRSGGVGRNAPGAGDRSWRHRRRHTPPPATAPAAAPSPQRRPSRRRPRDHGLRPGPRGTHRGHGGALVHPRPGAGRRPGKLRRGTSSASGSSRTPGTTPGGPVLTQAASPRSCGGELDRPDDRRV